jgi:anti-sigma B factor antagonist
MRPSELQYHAVAPAAAPALNVSAVVTEKTAVVRAVGELDLATAPGLAKVLQGLERECVRIVLDISGLTFIDSTGLRLAVIEHGHALMNGFDFAIAGARGQVLDVLRVTGLDVSLPLAPDVASVLDESR